MATEPCNDAQKDAVLQRLTEIRQRIAAACVASGRAESDVTLMAVTKTVPPELINTAIDAGVTVLGENRVQEYLSKREAYRETAQVQFIGHLQTNKVRQIIDKVTLIQSVDSLHLAETIDREAEKHGIVMPVLLEVNIGGESSKSGVSPDALPRLLESVQGLVHVRAEGLMTIPPPQPDIPQQERIFDEMRMLYERMQQHAPLHILSMGMSGDYEASVRCGATLVRIGSALFGARIYPQSEKL